jgi:hypothetical protein
MFSFERMEIALEKYSPLNHKTYFLQQSGASVELVRIDGVKGKKYSTVLLTIEEVIHGNETRASY